MPRSRREALRLLGGAALIPVAAATVGAHGEEAETPTLEERCEQARALRAAGWLTPEEVRWLEVHRGPEGFEDLGCEELPDGTVVRRRRRTLP